MKYLKQYINLINQTVNIDDIINHQQYEIFYDYFKTHTQIDILNKIVYYLHSYSQEFGIEQINFNTEKTGNIYKEVFANREEVFKEKYLYLGYLKIKQSYGYLIQNILLCHNPSFNHAHIQLMIDNILNCYELIDKIKIPEISISLQQLHAKIYSIYKSI